MLLRFFLVSSRRSCSPKYRPYAKKKRFSFKYLYDLYVSPIRFPFQGMRMSNVSFRDNHDSRWMLAAATVDLTPKYLRMPQKGKAWLRNGDSTPSRSRKKQSPCGKRPARVLERIGFVEGLESSFLIMAHCGNPLMPNYMVWRDSMGLPRVVFGQNFHVESNGLLYREWISLLDKSWAQEIMTWHCDFRDSSDGEFRNTWGLGSYYDFL